MYFYLQRQINIYVHISKTFTTQCLVILILISSLTDALFPLQLLTVGGSTKTTKVVYQLVVSACEHFTFPSVTWWHYTTNASSGLGKSAGKYFKLLQ